MTDALASFLAAAEATNRPTDAHGAWRSVDGPPEYGGRPVTNSPDLERILALPRRPQVDLTRNSTGGYNDPVAGVLVDFMNARLRRPDWQRTDCKCRSAFNRGCITTLTPAQAWALYEIMLTGGLLGLIATGGGKTGIGILAPLVAPNCRLAVGLLPANLMKQLVREYLLWREHWQVPVLAYGHCDGYPVLPDVRRMVDRTPWPVLHAISYQQLSQPENTNLLAEKSPDLVYADEMDKLANMHSARTIRFCRQFAAIPNTRFAGWTGTPWDQSIMELTHCAAFALRGGSPLPLEPVVAREWAEAIDPSVAPRSPGALRKLCKPGEELLDGFHRRLVETLGVVATQEGAIDIPLNLYERVPPSMPPVVAEMLDKVRGFERPDGEELVDALEVARVAQEVVQGFYYRWTFPTLPREPDGQLTKASKDLILYWLARRKAWRKELRKKIREGAPHLDSEANCEAAVQRYLAGYEGELPVWASETYVAWAAVKDSVQPVTQPVWVSDYLVEDAVRWAREHRGIVWYKHVTFGERVAQLGGFPLHGGGLHAEEAILAEKGETSIVVSLDSHGRGRDGLQYLYHEQLLVVPPSSGRKQEQFFARLHRTGQPKPEVNTWAYRHVEELERAFDEAFSRATFANATWGTNQKLLSANCAWR